MNESAGRTKSAPAAPALGEAQVVPAGPEHVEAIFALIEAATKSSRVLPRTRESIFQHLGGFRVAFAGGKMVACGALHRTSSHLAEIRSVVVADSARGHGLGARIVRELVEDARRHGLRRVFTLTDVTKFFAGLGFTMTGRETLPEKVWNDCVLCPKFNDCVEVAMELNLDEAE